MNKTVKKPMIDYKTMSQGELYQAAIYNIFKYRDKRTEMSEHIKHIDFGLEAVSNVTGDSIDYDDFLDETDGIMRDYFDCNYESLLAIDEYVKIKRHIKKMRYVLSLSKLESIYELSELLDNVESLSSELLD